MKQITRNYINKKSNTNEYMSSFELSIYYSIPEKIVNNLLIDFSSNHIDAVDVSNRKIFLNKKYLDEFFDEKVKNLTLKKTSDWYSSVDLMKLLGGNSTKYAKYLEQAYNMPEFKDTVKLMQSGIRQALCIHKDALELFEQTFEIKNDYSKNSLPGGGFFADIDSNNSVEISNKSISTINIIAKEKSYENKLQQLEVSKDKYISVNQLSKYYLENISVIESIVKTGKNIKYRDIGELDFRKYDILKTLKNTKFHSVENEELRYSLNEMSLSELNEIIKAYPYYIQYVKYPPESLQITAVKKDGLSLQYIDNPSEFVIKTAIKKNPIAIMFVKNPSEEIQIMAVKKDGKTIRLLENYSDKVKSVAEQSLSKYLLCINVNEISELEKKYNLHKKYVDNKKELNKYLELVYVNNKIYQDVHHNSKYDEEFDNLYQMGYSPSEIKNILNERGIKEFKTSEEIDTEYNNEFDRLDSLGCYLLDDIVKILDDRGIKTASELRRSLVDKKKINKAVVFNNSLEELMKEKEELLTTIRKFDQISHSIVKFKKVDRKSNVTNNSFLGIDLNAIVYYLIENINKKVNDLDKLLKLNNTDAESDKNKKSNDLNLLFGIKGMER